MKLNILFILFVLILGSPIFSTEIDFNGTNISFKDHKKNAVDVNENWRFHIGDKAEWANPKFNDSGWDTVYFPLTIEELIPFNYKGNIWLRSTFKITAKQIHFFKK